MEFFRIRRTIPFMRHALVLNDQHHRFCGGYILHCRARL